MKQNKWAYGKVKAESQSSDWDYSYIRTVNLMLDGIAGSQMNEADKNHWRSVGLFFRSYKYFLMMSKFGDIPWVDHVLPDNDPALFDYNALKDDPLIEVDTIGLKGSPTNVFKSFTPPQKGAGTMLQGDDVAAQLAGILAKKHLI